MTGKREVRLAQLAKALAALDAAALLDAWREAIAIRQAARPTRQNGDEAGLRAAVCETIAVGRFGEGRHVALYMILHGVAPQS